MSGATVIAEIPSRNHPFSIASLLGRTGPVATSAESDGDGLAKVSYLADRPVRLVVLLDGYRVWNEIFNPTKPAVIEVSLLSTDKDDL